METFKNVIVLTVLNYCFVKVKCRVLTLKFKTLQHFIFTNLTHFKKIVLINPIPDGMG